jgi:hypothetical protein
MFSQYGTHAGCGTLCTFGHTTKHGSTLHCISKHAAQLPNMSARRQLDTTRDMLCGTCFATTCALSHCKHASRRPTLATPPVSRARHRVRAAERLQRQRKLALLASSCSQTLLASFSRIDAAVEIAAAAVLDVDRQLQHQTCQASGGMAADSSEAVAACAAHLRWTEAAAKRRPKHAPKSKNGSWKHMVATCFRLVTRTPTRSGSMRPRGSRGDPSRAGAPAAPGGHGTGRSRASLDRVLASCNEFDTSCNEYCYISRKPLGFQGEADLSRPPSWNMAVHPSGTDPPHGSWNAKMPEFRTEGGGTSK